MRYTENDTRADDYLTLYKNYCIQIKHNIM